MRWLRCRGNADEVALGVGEVPDHQAVRRSFGAHPAFAAQARAIFPGLPVLFMSGYEQRESTADEWPGPGAQVIGKPFSRAALLARVTQLLTADAGAGELPRQRARSGSGARAERG